MPDFNTNFQEALLELDKIYELDALENKQIPELVTLVYSPIKTFLTSSSNLIENEEGEVSEVNAKGTKQENDTLNQTVEILANDLERLTKKIQTTKSITISKEDSTFEEVIENAINAAKKFGKGGRDSTWPYQLQLLCNAYIFEKAVLEELKTRDSSLRNAVVEYVRTNMASSIADELNKLASEEIDFNDAPDHSKIYFQNDPELVKIQKEILQMIKAGQKPSDELCQNFVSAARKKADISFGNDFQVEVKVAKGSSASNFHNADVVLICDIRNQSDLKIYIQHRKNPYYIKADEKESYSNPVHLKCELSSPLQFIKATTDAAIFSVDTGTNKNAQN